MPRIVKVIKNVLVAFEKSVIAPIMGAVKSKIRFEIVRP